LADWREPEEGAVLLSQKKRFKERENPHGQVGATIGEKVFLYYYGSFP